MSEQDEAERIKKMAGLLKSGAKMLMDACPECNAPLFKLRSGQIICALCDRRVMLVKPGEEGKVLQTMVLSDLERGILEKLQELGMELYSQQDPQKLRELLAVVHSCLEVLERLRKLAG